MTFDFRIAQYF